MCGRHGGHNAADVVQATHGGILEGAGCLEYGRLVRCGKPLPRATTGHVGFSRVHHAAYVDDHLIVAIVLKRLVQSKSGPDAVLRDRSHAAYAAANLPLSEDKSFAFPTNFVA